MQATEHTACNPSGSDHLRRTLAAQHGFTTHHRINTTPCSLPSRKSSNVQGNVLAVTVPTFATNCHFLVKRKEDFLIPRVVVFLLSPLNSIIRFVVPAILAIPASAAIVKFEWDTIGRWLVRIWGFGAPEHPPPRLPTTTRTNASERRNSKLIFGGRILLPVLFIAQCVMSIILFVRRAWRGAAALVDFRIFYLAASGLAFNIIAIGQMFLQETPALLSKVRDKEDSLKFRPLQRGLLYISELACWVFFVQFLHMYETPQERAVS
jgi:hypothetical protein